MSLELETENNTLQNQTTIRFDHFCFEIDKEWVVGYGLDDNSLKRNYRNIYKIN